MKLKPALLGSACLLLSLPTFASSLGVVISQIYGGGGNSGATLKNDYIELLNAGSAPVSLNGWSVQYASTAGTTWAVTPLTNLTLQPGQYYLVQALQGAGGTQDLPTPDAIGTLAMSGSAGKVALASAVAPLSGTQPVSASLVDLVGYGTTPTGFEGAPTGANLTSTTAALRALAGCTDTDNNASDFGVGAPAPRNSAAALVTCGGGTDPDPQAVSIPAIQGTGSTSPFAGQRVTTSGVVTRVNNNGFFLQDPAGDGNPLSSDGILVFTSSAPSVVAGQLVQLVGTVAEFNTGAAGNADTAAHTVTELTGTSGITVLASGHTVAPLEISLPETVNDELERYEGMLVKINGPLTASQNYFQGRYGQVTLSAGGRLEVPTNRARPGPAAQALADENARRRIVLDDGTSQQNPNPTPYFAADNTLRAGDTVASVTGVVDYGLATSSNAGFGDYKLHPTAEVVFTRDHPRTAAPADVGGNVKLASFNVLNYFTTFLDGSTADGQTGQGCTLGGSVSAGNCRGANNLAEFVRQRDKIVEAIAAINADAVGLMEIQNNGQVAVQNLVAALNQKMGAGTYAPIALPAAGTGTDAIRVAMIYKPAKLATVGLPLSDTDPVNNRPTLAQTFAPANGEKFSVVVNHLKSKSCGDDSGPDADQGDLQGCYNATRIAQAQRLTSFVADLQASSGSSDVLMLGDFNAYAKEDPIDLLTSAGFVDQIGRFNEFGYSYVFDGAAGRLDHALTSGSLGAKVASATEWHINADEPSVIDYNVEFKQPVCAACGPDYYTATPYRSSDHDPVVLGAIIVKQIFGSTGPDKLTGTPGDDWITGGPGKDRLSGGAGVNVYAYTGMADAADTLLDFVSGKDLVDLRDLLASIGYTGTDPVADGYVDLVPTVGGSALRIDRDGSGGKLKPKRLLTFKGVPVSGIDLANDLIVVTPAMRVQQRRTAAR